MSFADKMFDLNFVWKSVILSLKFWVCCVDIINIQVSLSNTGDLKMYEQLKKLIWK